ncbi:hypothetical protein C1H46_020749 [Malus baccata]|uniref:F-box domain-containing protein n=1 Tax=Malus baccata TaxID=106549 RepID=A0A540M4N7_MALBA|nr:hypothetical protein C1H46_020749 [Malus baccata]
MTRDWANLPKEPLYLVVERLESPVEFSFVCKPWRWAVKDIYKNPLRQMLLISWDKKDRWNLYNVAEDKVVVEREGKGREGMARKGRFLRIPQPSLPSTAALSEKQARHGILHTILQTTTVGQ